MPAVWQRRATLVAIDREASTIAGAPATDPPAAVAADALAYILFTSGTTGAPKPVGVPHRAIVRLVHGLPAIPLGDRQTVLAQGDFTLYFGNSLAVTVVSLALILLFGAMAAFALAEYRFPGNTLLGLHGVTVMWPRRRCSTRSWMNAPNRSRRSGM
jgi:ABC-type glycerol-3-phosphate transport system permease component